MYVNIREWREEIPWTQAQLYSKTVELGSPVSISTIQAAEKGDRISKIKAQAILKALNAGLLAEGVIKEPLELKDIAELQIA